MSGQIFISYRREDSPGWARLLFERLSARFASHKIFIDVNSLAPGVDFVEDLEQTAAACDVLIAVIGKHYLISSDAKPRRRLNDPKDFVRLEIATALKHNVPIIPVLVDGAPMPMDRDLPDALKSLARRQAVEVSHTRFDTDSQVLINRLDEVFKGKTAAEQRKSEEKERLEAQRRELERNARLEAERRQREEQDRLGTEEREKERLVPKWAILDIVVGWFITIAFFWEVSHCSW